MSFEVDRVYTVDPSDRSANMRDGSEIKLARADVPIDELEYFPVTLTGLRTLDFAVFATSMDLSGTYSHRFLVTRSPIAGRTTGQVANAEAIAAYPEKFVTRDLARRVLTLSTFELNQFTLDERILRQIAIRFQGMRGIRN